MYEKNVQPKEDKFGHQIKWVYTERTTKNGHSISKKKKMLWMFLKKLSPVDLVV